VKATISDSAVATKTLGVWISPGLGQAWGGGLKAPLMDLYTSRVGGLPWLPPGWLVQVRELQARFPDDLVRVAPAYARLAINPDLPAWIGESKQRADVWQEIFAATNSAVGKFAAGKQAEGKPELDRLARNAVFWDRAYNIAVSVRDFVPNTVGFVGKSLWSGLGWKLKLMIGIAAVGAGLYFCPSLRRNWARRSSQ